MNPGIAWPCPPMGSCAVAEHADRASSQKNCVQGFFHETRSGSATLHVIGSDRGLRQRMEWREGHQPVSRTRRNKVEIVLTSEISLPYSLLLLLGPSHCADTFGYWNLLMIEMTRIRFPELCSERSSPYCCPIPNSIDSLSLRSAAYPLPAQAASVTNYLHRCLGPAV